MRKKLVAILICFCTLVLCGCSSPVEYSLYQDPEGKVTEVSYIPFSMTELRMAGVDEVVILALQKRIVDKMYNYYFEQKVRFVDRVNSDPDLTDEEKKILKEQYNSELQEPIIMEGVGEVYEITTAGIVTNSDYVKFSLVYDSIVCYYMAKKDMTYAELKEELKKDDTTIVEGFGVNQKVSNGNTIYSAMYDEERMLAEFILDECRGLLRENTNMTNEQIEQILPSQFLYRYGTSTPRLRSNADKTMTSGGVYFHEWILETETNEQGQKVFKTREIKTWTNHANKEVWYVITLAVSVLLVAGLFVYDKIKNRKSKEQSEIEVIDQ